jgi:hypothetical protein
MSILSQAITGRKIKPLAILVYGVHGIGKTTLPSEAANPIYVGSEENDEIDSARLPKVVKWSQFIDQLKALRDENHTYKTLVIDTMDSLEQVAQAEILSGKEANKSMATAMGGYGKAYEKMAEMFLDVRDNFLAPLRDAKGMNIVILAHAEKSKHEDPMTLTSYDTFSTSLHKKVKPIFQDWVSAILFINYWRAKTSLNDGREVALGDGSRMIYTEERPSHVAKNRFELPYEIEFEKSGTWAKLVKHIKDHYAQAPQPEKKEEAPEIETNANAEAIQVMKAIDELFAKVPDEQKDRIATSIKRAGKELSELNRIYKKMQTLTK